MVHSLTQGLRRAHQFFDFIIGRLFWMLTTPVLKWCDAWTIHRGTIIFLATINTTLTTVSEIGSRTLISVASHQQQDAFLIESADGSQRIHRQSLVNIVMTLLATVLGGPVYFITARLHRFFFFISFGVVNSLLSQSLSGLIMDGFVLIIGRRLAFDFFYNASVKFLLFEFVRPFLLKYRQSAIKVTLFRVGQDFLTTCIRVLILNILKLGGH